MEDGAGGWELDAVPEDTKTAAARSSARGSRTGRGLRLEWADQRCQAGLKALQRLSTPDAHLAPPPLRQPLPCHMPLVQLLIVCRSPDVICKRLGAAEQGEAVRDGAWMRRGALGTGRRCMAVRVRCAYSCGACMRRRGRLPLLLDASPRPHVPAEIVHPHHRFRHRNQAVHVWGAHVNGHGACGRGRGGGRGRLGACACLSRLLLQQQTPACKAPALPRIVPARRSSMERRQPWRLPASRPTCLQRLVHFFSHVARVVRVLRDKRELVG